MCYSIVVNVALHKKKRIDCMHALRIPESLSDVSNSFRSGCLHNIVRPVLVCACLCVCVCVCVFEKSWRSSDRAEAAEQLYKPDTRIFKAHFKMDTAWRFETQIGNFPSMETMKF